jgi:hypothetical protein
MYSIVAHEVEFVGRFHLLTAGVVERLDPSMSTFEEQLKVMGYIMKETALED